MAAGLVSHNITTASGVTFAVVSWVPDTAAPDVGAVPVARITDGTNVAPVSATLGLTVNGSGVTQPVSGTVSINPIPAGSSNIGDVDVLTLPAIPAGNNNIGDVDVATLPVQFGAGAATGTTQRVTIDSGQVGALVMGAVPVVSGGTWYQTVAVSTTATIQASAGAAGDYLESILCIVATAATSKVMIGDGAAPAVVVLPDNVGAGVGSYPIPIGAISKTGSWRVTTAAGVTAIVTGKFS